LKAVTVLIIIYVATFLVATRDASPNLAEAAPQQGNGAQQEARAAIDPAKEADLRSLMELLGVRDTAEQAAAKAAEQYRQTLSASVPDNDSGRQFMDSFVGSFQRRFNPNDVTDQLVSIYDLHFNGEEIKGLLVFYGSPLGQKYASELPKVTLEAQAASRTISARVAKEVLQDLKRQYPGIGAQARLSKPSPSPGETKESAQPQQP
jgi:hypothetical protein